MDKHSRIFVAGHNGLVGGAIVRHLQAAGFTNVIVRSRNETDLENQSAVLKLFLEEKPEYVFMAAADVAETAAGLLKGRTTIDDELDPEAAAALSARVDAGGFETESYTDRLASLLPGHGEGSADGEPRVTQIIVNGLVSVSSIASFKRHVGRLPGVTAVQVASGPDGEFVFNVTHRPDVSFRDAIPSMPGFAARVTATGDGVVNVTARDPEAEG